MELFGALCALPFAGVVAAFYPRWLLKISENRGFFFVLIMAASCLVAGLVVLELALIFKLGIVAAHDQFKPSFDVLHGWNVLLGPAAITNLIFCLLRRCVANERRMCLATSIACFSAIVLVLGSHLWIDETAHYRTDSEGTFRIKD